MAAKDNVNVSDIDKTSFWWAGLCGICHTGGGPTEYDRDGQKFFDVVTGEFGYEKLGKTAADVTLDGDYCEVNHMTGDLRVAPWDKTGVAEPDCLYCHRSDRMIDQGKNMNWIWRTAVLRAKDKLKDSQGNDVPAFASASTAAQGWFSSFALNPNVPAGKPPMATTLDIDYQAGVNGGSLVVGADGNLYLPETLITREPTDYACWGCHLTPDLKKRGRSWFDTEKDVHYAGFNNLRDADPDNDRMPVESTACTRCHPADGDHNISKGNATLGSVRNDTDYEGFRTCRDCHDPSSIYYDPSATTPTHPIHTIPKHLDVMSCEMCHIPYKADPAALVVDNATTGSTIGYNTAAFLSADPLDPTNADKSRWYPQFELKTDRDGQVRLFPTKLLHSVWWGDWDQNGTPGDLTDDTIAPLALWRVRGLTTGAPLPGVTDDNGDGKPEVNTLAEIEIYLLALESTNDKHGTPLAGRAVLIKGGKVYYLSGGGGVVFFDYEGTGIHTESSHPFSVNHNVRAAGDALGSTSCGECHTQFNGGAPTTVFDRLILTDPWDVNGNPVYEPMRDHTGIDPN